MGDIDCNIVIAVSKFFKNVASGVFALGSRSMTYRELIALSGLNSGPRVDDISL